MHTLLFDIDGTLISTGGAGFKAIRLAMNTLFGIAEIPTVDVSGRTDCAILRDLFDLLQLEFDQHIGPFSELYWKHLPNSLAQTEGRLLPGVRELLSHLDAHPDISVGILTGNSRRAADIKLRHFDLQAYFRFGGFGDHHACRNGVAQLAWESAREFLGQRFDPEKVWVIGDTIHDIRCARSIGAYAVAVETGGSPLGELQAACPDAQFESLLDGSFLTLFEE